MPRLFSKTLKGPQTHESLISTRNIASSLKISKTTFQEVLYRLSNKVSTIILGIYRELPSKNSLLDMEFFPE